MDKAQWMQLADDCVADAKALLDAARWAAAYYLVGYAVECGLKACIVGHVAANPGVIFRAKGYAEKCWTHDIEKLVDAADLEAARAAETAANMALGQNWMIVKDWREASRYEQKSEAESRKLFDAVSDPHSGVLSWIKAHW